MPAMTIRVVAAFFASGGLNAGHAGRDRLRPGQGHRAGRERPQQDQEHRPPAVVSVAASMAPGGMDASPRTMIRYAPIAIISRALNRNR